MAVLWQKGGETQGLFSEDREVFQLFDILVDFLAFGNKLTTSLDGFVNSRFKASGGFSKLAEVVEGGVALSHVRRIPSNSLARKFFFVVFLLFFGAIIY